MPAPPTWRSRPIFITSTFRDMHAERDWLRVHVFPVLEDRLRERFHHLETIDLRWGVDSASADQEHDRERVVLTVCLREIQRSRPFLIGLLGDRYGWRPPGGRLNEVAREAGIDANLDGKSVTELEILHGVLRASDQKRRSWFYLRAPLPYAVMTQAVAGRYSEAYSGEPHAADNADKLTALKARLREALPGRVREYSTRWDENTQSVVGLEAWGAQVLEDLWSDLEAETAEFLSQRPQTWHEQDRWELDAFIEMRVRGFVGRTAVTNALVSLVTSPAAEGAPWGACITAEAGGGKSSLFGHLFRTLQNRDVLVLAHAAGISVRSAQLDLMLRRWIGELAVALGHLDPVDDRASPSDVDQAFSRLLEQAAARRRVVVMIDALNQFEPTTRAIHLQWLPMLWPPNARLVATAIPGRQSANLLQRPGVAEARLPPVDRDEAVAIVRGICSRYHRTLNASVEASLLDKTRGDGTPAFANPLWLELATEELNLLGGEAFDRADATTGAEGIVRLLQSESDRMPVDVEGLYAWMLDRAERHFGLAWTRAFVSSIALSRAGWRDSDLERVVPTLSGETWDPLRLATLRRAFRAHIVQRGAHAQWDFAHAQLRESVLSTLLARVEDRQRLHVVIASYLETLDRSDPLHQTETMVHWIRAADASRAARYYGRSLSRDELSGATDAVIRHLIDSNADDATNWIASLLNVPGLDRWVRGRLCRHYLTSLIEAGRGRVTRRTRWQLLLAVRKSLDDLLKDLPSDIHSTSDLSLCISMQTEFTDLVDDFESTRSEIGQAVQLAVGVAEAGEDSGPLAMSYIFLGDSLVAKGDLAQAQEAYAAAQVVAETNENACGLAVIATKQGDAYRAAGSPARALQEYARAITVAENAVAADGARLGPQLALSAGRQRMGALLSDAGDHEGALVQFKASVAIANELVRRDPENVDRRWELAEAYLRLAATSDMAGREDAAMDAYERWRELAEAVIGLDSGDHERRRRFARLSQRLGDLQSLRGARRDRREGDAGA